MCDAYKKQRWVICLLNRSPNLIDRKKCSSGENTLYQNRIQLKKGTYQAYTH